MSRQGLVLLGVAGGIAAYKAADLASKLVQQDVGVSVVMTSAACKFITPLTFEYITGNPVVTTLWEKAGGHSPDHIAISDAAEMAVVAPATADIIGKMANGLADDALSTILMAFDRQTVIAPAMNARMYQSAAVQDNLRVLQNRGVKQVGPERGRLACGEEGIGRMADVSQILTAVFNELPGYVV